MNAAVPRIKVKMNEKNNRYDSNKLIVYGKPNEHIQKPQQQSNYGTSIQDLSPYLLALIPLALFIGAATAFGLAALIGKDNVAIALATQQQIQNNNNNIIDVIDSSQLSFQYQMKRFLILLYFK